MNSHHDRLKCVPVRRWLTFAVIALGLLVISTQTAFACPNCRENLSQQGGNLPLGFALSIVLMLSTPFTILAIWMLWLARYLRSDARLNSAPATPAALPAAIGKLTC